MHRQPLTQSNGWIYLSNMGIEQPVTQADKNRNPREEAAMNRGRILSDAEFIKGGAEVGAKGETHPTEEQISGMKDRLKRAEDVINHLESHWFQEDLNKLREQGKGQSRDMRELHSVSDRIKLNEWFVTHNAALANEVREDGVKEFKENQEKFEELRKRLGGFLSAIQEFAQKYNVDRLGGLSIAYKSDGNELELAKNVGENFESADQLFDAIMQARDAKLYRAYAEKKEITGKM